jgi:transposase
MLQDYIHAVQDAEARLDRLTRQIEELLPNWSMAPVVAALQAMRGVALVVAVTVVAEVGDFRRFANARQLMAYLGLVPSEHSSGASVRRGSITKAGNVLARRVLIERAWTPAFAGAGSTACRHASAASFTTATRSCRRRSAISPGKARSGCARAIGGWLRRASPRS